MRGLVTLIPPNVQALGIVSFLTDTSREMVYPLLPLFLTRTLGAGVAFVGHLSSLTRPLMAVALLPGHVLGIRFLDRIGNGIRTSPRDALIADSTPAEKRGAPFGFHRAMDHLGAVAGPVLAFHLLPRVAADHRAIFWLASLPAALCVVMLMAIVREVRLLGGSVRSS